MTSQDPAVLRFTKLLGMPDNLLGFEFKARVGEMVSVRCEFHPSMEPNEAGELETAFADYELRRRGEPAAELNVRIKADMGFAEQQIGMIACLMSQDPVERAIGRVGFRALAEAQEAFDQWRRDLGLLDKSEQLVVGVRFQEQQ